MNEIVDLWTLLEPIFTGQVDEYPEITLLNPQPDMVKHCLTYLMGVTHDCHISLRVPGTRKKVIMPSPAQAIRSLCEGQLVGTFWMTLPALPLLGIYVDGPDTLSLSFARNDWTAMSVLALFDLLQLLVSMAPATRIFLQGTSYEPEELKLFETTWREYWDAHS